MTLIVSLSHEAVQLFHDEWQHQPSHTRMSLAKLDCALTWMMPELLRLAQEFDDQPLRYMRPLVYRKVLEFDFAASHAGVNDETDDALDRYVDTLVVVIEKVRDIARERGQWICTPAAATPPMMVG